MCSDNVRRRVVKGPDEPDGPYVYGGETLQKGLVERNRVLRCDEGDTGVTLGVGEDCECCVET